MSVKVCTKCLQEKPLKDFYKQSGRSDGRRSHCRECMNSANETYRHSHPEQTERSRERSREYILSSAQKERKKERNRGYYLSSRLQNEARRLLNKTVQEGVINRLPCSVCGAFPSDAHHDDYSKPLDVRWLCKKHHGEVHKTFLRC